METSTSRRRLGGRNKLPKPSQFLRRLDRLPWTPPPAEEDWDAELEGATPPPRNPAIFSVTRWRLTPRQPSERDCCTECGGLRPMEVRHSKGYFQCYYCKAVIGDTYWRFLKHLDRCPKLPGTPGDFLKRACRCSQRR